MSEEVPVLLTDSHMHTPLCKHALGEPEEYAEVALARGFDAIVFTCHSPMPTHFWPAVRMETEEFDEYCEMIRRAEEVFEGRLRIGIGIESDWFPGFETWLEELHSQVKMEHVLGSVHFFGPEYMREFGHCDGDTFVRQYFDHLVESAQWGLFDTLAHPDLIKNQFAGTWNFDDVAEHVGQCLDEIAKTGVGMELNTSGLHKRVPEMNPGRDMLAMMATRQIPLIIGSDAHRPHRVGDDFEEALTLAEGAGYKEIQMMWGRKRHPMKIEEARTRLVPLPDPV